VGLFLEIHPENPQERLIHRTVAIIRQGGVIAYPTDSGYALGCHIGDKAALDRVRQIRDLDGHHNFTLICRDLSEISVYARFDTPVFRLLRKHTPGAYTFILEATKEVPKRLMHPKKKTIGLRIPDHPIVRALLAELNEPMLTTTLILPGDAFPINDAAEIEERIGVQLDLILDGGPSGAVPTTVVDLTGNEPRIARQGRGDTALFF
jgi:tRNA threonylcarbamoyl adenosine modification protein (Sua5/YciO/YrdC/YwlC family)